MTEQRGSASEAVSGHDRRPGGEDAAKLSLQGIGKTFGSGEGIATILESIDLDVKEGEFVALLGPSGCGKTTLLNIIAGLIPQNSGAVLLDGRKINGPGPDRGVLFQDYALFPWKSVRDNVAFGLRYGPRARRPDRAERSETVAHYIELVGLSGSEHKYPRQLSGGMQQRTALARLWATDPDVLLMDEPLAAVDAQARLVMQYELLRIWGQEHSWNERKTVVYVTHSIEEAVFLADRIVVMGTQPGQIKAVISVDQARPRTEATRAEARFEELHQQVWHLIQGEAYRATLES